MAADTPETASDLFSTATRRFTVEGTPGERDAVAFDAPEPPASLSGADSFDVPEPGFGFQPVRTAPRGSDALVPAPEDAPLPVALHTGGPQAVPLPPAGLAFADAIDAPEPQVGADLTPVPSEADVPEPSSFVAPAAAVPRPASPCDSTPDLAQVSSATVSSATVSSATMVPHAGDEPLAGAEPEPPSAGFGAEAPVESGPSETEEPGEEDEAGFESDLYSGADADEAAGDDGSDQEPAAVTPGEEGAAASHGMMFAFMGVAAVVIVALLVWVLVGVRGNHPPEVAPPTPTRPPAVAPVHQPTPQPPPEPAPVPPVVGLAPGSDGADAGSAIELPVAPAVAPPSPGPGPAPVVQHPVVQPVPAVQPVQPPPVVPPRPAGTPVPAGTSTPPVPAPVQPQPTAGSPWTAAPAPASVPVQPAPAPAATQGGDREIWGSASDPPPAATTGSLTVRSNPQGATVWVGDVRIGVTPIVGHSLPAGSAIVRVEMGGYSTVSKVAGIRAGQASDLGTINLESLTPVSGYVALWGEGLDGAKLYIDNKYVGEMPVKVQLTEGKHDFFVQPPTGDAFNVSRQVHFDVQGIGISIELVR